MNMEAQGIGSSSPVFAPALRSGIYKSDGGCGGNRRNRLLQKARPNHAESGLKAAFCMIGMRPHNKKEKLFGV